MAQLLVGIVLVLQASYIRPEYFTDGFLACFPAWPRFDAERALRLFGGRWAFCSRPSSSACIALIDGPHRSASGGAIRLILFAGIVEIILSASPGADHDADPVGSGRRRSCRAATPAGIRSGATTVRFRFRNIVRRHRTHIVLGLSAAVRRHADFALPRHLDVADDRRPDPGHPAVLGERSIVDRRRAARAGPAHAGGDFAARHRSAIQRPCRGTCRPGR